MQQQYSTVNKHYRKNTGTGTRTLSPQNSPTISKFRLGEIKKAIKAFIPDPLLHVKYKKKGYPFLSRVKILGLTH